MNKTKWDSVVTGGVIAALALTLSVGANAALDSGTFTVKAQDSKDPSIVAFAGIDPRGSDPDPDNPDPGGEIDPDPSDPDETASRTFSCGDESLVITAAMQEFSDANKALRDAGKDSEMLTYPDGGWKIIEEDPLGQQGVAFTNGETLGSFNPITNSAGWGLFFDTSNESAPDDCRMLKIENGLPHAIGSLAVVSVQPNPRTWEGSILIEEYLEQNELAVRADGKPASIDYFGITRDSGVQYEKWNTDVSGSAWRMLEREFDSEGTVISVTATNNTDEVSASSYEDRGEVPQDVWDNFWNGGY